MSETNCNNRLVSCCRPAPKLRRVKGEPKADGEYLLMCMNSENEMLFFCHVDIKDGIWLKAGEPNPCGQGGHLIVFAHYKLGGEILDYALDAIYS